MVELKKTATITRHPKGEVYKIVAATSDFLLSDDNLRQIVSICSEPLIYEVLFKTRLEGRLYALENAVEFVKWANKGWEENKWFVYLIKDVRDNIVGAIDIKSDNLEAAEIGYWMSHKTPGIMTNAVIKICELGKSAGYKSLYGFTVPDNIKSQKVLERAGFVNNGNVWEKDKEYIKFTKSLSD